MFDSVHDGVRCGQVKCWGKSLSDYAPGMAVTLHVALDQAEAIKLAEAVESDAAAGPHDPRWTLLYDGRPSDAGDYQVLCEDGSALVVEGGVFTAWAPAPRVDLKSVDNRGRPASLGGSPAVLVWVASDAPGANRCTVCHELAAGGH